jgi:alpha-tubulin suppressor-like RCC1 family protein
MLGDAQSGLAGDGTYAMRSTPTQASRSANISKISVGGSHGVAVTSDGKVLAWGGNTNGQLGDSTTTQRRSPVQITGLVTVSNISANGNYTVAQKADGTVWAWGINTEGQLGDGTTSQRTAPDPGPCRELVWLPPGDRMYWR